MKDLIKLNDASRDDHCKLDAKIIKICADKFHLGSDFGVRYMHSHKEVVAQTLLCPTLSYVGIKKRIPVVAIYKTCDDYIQYASKLSTLGQLRLTVYDDVMQLDESPDIFNMIIVPGVGLIFDEVRNYLINTMKKIPLHVILPFSKFRIELPITSVEIITDMKYVSLFIFNRLYYDGAHTWMLLENQHDIFYGIKALLLHTIERGVAPPRDAIERA